MSVREQNSRFSCNACIQNISSQIELELLNHRIAFISKYLNLISKYSRTYISNYMYYIHEHLDKPHTYIYVLLKVTHTGHLKQYRELHINLTSCSRWVIK